MNYLLIFILFIYLLSPMTCRPSQREEEDDSEMEEADYGGCDSAAQDDSRQDEDAPANEPFSDRKYSRLRDPRGEEPVNTDSYQSRPKLPSNKYIINEDPNERSASSQRLSNRDVYKSNDLQKEGGQLKKAPETQSNDESDLLVDTNKRNREQMEYNNEAIDTTDQSRSFKQYYSTMQAENRAIQGHRRYDSDHYNWNRGRREAERKDSDESKDAKESTKNESPENPANEDDEAAIKRHVKKLSNDELEELLSSLSDDKKALLKKIMENDAENNLNKREITKKSDVVEEMNLVENAPSELNKVQEGSVAVKEAPISLTSITTESTKVTEAQSELAEVAKPKSGSKAVETLQPSENKMEPVDSTLKLHAVSSDNKTPETSNTNSAKRESKRETGSDATDMDMSSFDYAKMPENDPKGFNDQSYVCAQDEDLSKLTDDSSFDNRKEYKRDAYLYDNPESLDTIKSLENSFPNSKAYDENPYFGSDMAPLVRVKRHNLDVTVKKRAAALLPDAKVAFFPYKAENEDQDSDEGNEFDDDGFYDRTSNLAKSIDKQSVNDVERNHCYNLQHSKLKTIDNSKNENMNLETDSMKLGTDTDSVLSGVEGVDDNLMYNNGARNRRALENDSPKIAEPPLANLDTKNRQLRSTPAPEDELKVGPEINASNYQESDTFGSLPRNYEGDLSRYKRIRHAKQPSTDERRPDAY